MDAERFEDLVDAQDSYLAAREEEEGSCPGLSGPACLLVEDDDDILF